MAIKIKGTNVINDNLRIGIGLSSIYGEITTGGTQSISNRELIYVTSDSQIITLPSSPNPGNEVEIVVGKYRKVEVSPGSNYRIMERILGEKMIIDIPYASVRLIYVNSTFGWIIA